MTLSMTSRRSLSSNAFSAGRISVDFVTLVDVPFSPSFSPRFVAFRRIRPSSRAWLRVSDWMTSGMFPPPDDDDDDDDDSDTFACDVWEQVVELVFQFCGSYRANDRFLATVVGSVSTLAGLLAERPALFFHVYDFVLKRIEKEKDGYAALASLLDRLSDGERRRRALDDKVLETLCAKLAALNGLAKLKGKSVGDDSDGDEFDFALFYERRCAELLSALKSLCIGVPDVLAALVRLPGAVSNLASVTSIWLSYNESADEEDEDFEIVSDYPFSDTLFVLVHAAQLSSPVRSQMLSPEIVALMQVVAKFELDCVCLASYLAFLFLVDGALRWPRAFAARRTVAKRVSVRRSVLRSRGCLDGARRLAFATGTLLFPICVRCRSAVAIRRWPPTVCGGSRLCATMRRMSVGATACSALSCV